MSTRHSSGMNLLITTQAVDLDDPVLAFFHRWIEEFSRSFEHVHVICLKKGRHSLPANVTVHSLGKENSTRSDLQLQRQALKMRVGYALRFLRYAWILRREYDAVFVHMNPEYVVLAGWLWKVLGKKMALWYIHPRSSWRLRIACAFVDSIISATKDSFPLVSRKLSLVGLGVDTDFFSPGERAESEVFRLMLVARIAPVKRVECVVGAVIHLKDRGVPVSFDYYGGELPRDKAYADTIRKLASLAFPAGVWNWKGDSASGDVRDAYRSHDVHINATDTGSFDKAVLESMATGCITIVSNRAFKGVVPDELLFDEGDSASLARSLERIYRMPVGERAALRARMRSIAEESYSLSALVGRVAALLKK